MAADEPVKRLAVPRAQDLAELSIHDPRARRRLLVWPNQVPLTSSGAKYCVESASTPRGKRGEQTGA